MAAVDATPAKSADPSPLCVMEGRPVREFLRAPALAMLDVLWASCSLNERRVLQPLGAFLQKHRRPLDEIRTTRPGRKLNIPSGLADELPLITTLLLCAEKSDHRFPGLDRLLLIAIADAVEKGEGKDRKRVAALAESIRGALDGSNKGLRALLAKVDSILSLGRVMDQWVASGANTPHKALCSAWTKWIRGRIVYWTERDPELQRVGLLPPSLAPSLDDPEVTLVGGSGIDGDDDFRAEIVLTEPLPMTVAPSPTVARAKALAIGMVRASQGDLLLAPDQIVPAEWVQDLVARAYRSAGEALPLSDPIEAESRIALAFAAATGIREIDLPLIQWGRVPRGFWPVVDPDLPVLHRPITRPANAVRPGPEALPYLEQSLDVVRWPLPPSLHAWLRRFAERGAIEEGAPVFPELVYAVGRAYRLWDVASEVGPEMGLAPGSIRRALASAIAEDLGSEVAQITLGDTFSFSPGPAYYTAASEDALIEAVNRVHRQWFGECAALESRGQRFGSRLILLDEAAQEWPKMLRLRLISTARQAAGPGSLEAWRAHRDHLAAALSAVTGARPSDWVARITLDQVIPEYGLVLLEDKAADALREVRVAATGRRWLADFRRYLDRLGEIASGALGGDAARLAAAILRSESPLFAVMTIDGKEEALHASDLTRSMPAGLQGVPNHLRHRLNQVLLRHGVPHELRHAQLGWVVSPAFTLADLSHWSARQLGEALADTLDQILVKDGWYNPSQRTGPWSWRGVPDRPVKDWAAEIAAHEARHRKGVRDARAKLLEQWKAIEADVLVRLQRAVATYLPSLSVDVESKTLARAHIPGPDKKGLDPVAVTADHHALLCDAVQQGDARPDAAAEAIATRIVLYRLVRGALRKGLIAGPVPSRPFLSSTADPSPFFPGLGLAVRQAEALRSDLLARAKLNKAFDQAPLTAWTVAAFSSTRQLTEVQAAVAHAAGLKRSMAYPDLVRVPARIDKDARPMVFSGLPALALTRRGVGAPKGTAPKIEKMGEWAKSTFGSLSGLPDDPEICANRLASLLQAAGRLELSGLERLVSAPNQLSAAVDIDRCLARDDAWPVRNTEAGKEDEDEAGGVILEPAASESGAKRTRTAKEQKEVYGRLLESIDPIRVAARENAKSDGKRGQHQKIGRRLEALAADAKDTGNVSLLIGFVLHRHRFGGEKTPELAARSLSTELSRFGSTLLDVAGEQDILQWTAVELHQHYLATILLKPDSARRQCFDALKLFHRYLRYAYGAPEIDEADLLRHAGTRMTVARPGLLTPSEVLQVHGALLRDIEDETGLPDAEPEAIRILRLRELMFLVLEASGIRPASAHGLTLGDMVLLGPGRDFVRIRDTGEYGSVKSASALGFVPLEGALWEGSRQKVIDWLSTERHAIEALGGSWWKMPLFARRPGDRRRILRDHLTRRIDALLKWSTGDRRAQTYWLRKTRVTERHLAIASSDRPLAANVYRVLRHCGHATIETPIGHYIGDPAVTHAQSLSWGREASRGLILDLTSIKGAVLDVAWQRAGGAAPGTRTAVVLERLHAPMAPRPSGRETAPPVLRRRGALLPRHLADFARAIDACGDRQEAILRSGLTDVQVIDLERAARALVQKRGVTPWPFDGLRQPSAVLGIPRSLDRTAELYKLLNDEPSAELTLLAHTWVDQANLQCLHESRVVIEIDSREVEEAARWLLQKTALRISLVHAHGSLLLAGATTEAPARSHVAPLRWVLALAWIFGAAKKRPQPEAAADLAA